MTRSVRPRHVVAIGTSAGGIEALRELVAELPSGFPAAIVIVMHTSPQSPGVLPAILTRAGPLPAVNPSTTEQLQAGTIYVAPPDRHLVVEPGHVRVVKGPKENRFRPAIDPLFRSVAQVYGPGAIGVILTGNLDDGTAGLWAIKQLGGTTIVQHPDDALFPSMPASALTHVAVDHVVPLHAVAPLLVELTAGEPGTARREVPEALEIEVKIAKEEDPLQAGTLRLGAPSRFACPECHGVLIEMREAGRLRYRCHTGHAYSMDSLVADVREQIEIQLWTTIRAMQEGNLLMRTVAKHANEEHPSVDAASLQRHADDLQEQANRLRDMVTSGTASELALSRSRS